jgi:channel protein (hemolysin III family)
VPLPRNPHHVKTLVQKAGRAIPILSQAQGLCHLPGFYEPFSAISHLAGAGVFLVLGAILLWRGRGDRGRLIFLGIYAIACVLLFAISGIYHMMVRATTARAVMERLDHGAIFVLIAGTFTPAHGILFRGLLRWGPLCVIWTMTIAGIVLKTIFFESINAGLGLVCYLALGWCGIVSAFFIARRHGLCFIVPAVLGGLAYTIGGIAAYLQWPVVAPGWIHPHEVFHVAVLVGALFLWRFTWQFAGATIQIKIKPGAAVKPI